MKRSPLLDYQVRIDSEELKNLQIKAFSNPQDQDAAMEFFKLSDCMDPLDSEVKLKTLKLNFLHHNNKFTALNSLADHYIKVKKPLLAKLCLAESLRIKSDQKNKFLQFCELESVQMYPEFRISKPVQTSVSVVMATYNRGQGIRTSLQSILDQDYIDFEVIVVNDGGSKEAEDVIKKLNDPRIKYFSLPQNKGLSAALNYGIRQASGKWIAFLDDDDVFYPNHLSGLVPAMENGARVAYSTTNAVFGSEKNGIFSKDRNAFKWEEEFNRENLIDRIYITTCSVLVERNLFADIGLFCEDYTMSMDWDFWLRASLKTEFVHVRQVSSEYRLNVTNSTILNRVDAYFWGRLVANYHAQCQGKIAKINYFLKQKQVSDAEILFTEILKNYTQVFNHPIVMESLIDISELLGYRKFTDSLVKDYFRRHAGACIRFLRSRADVRKWSNIMTLFPGRVINAVKARLSSIGS